MWGKSDERVLGELPALLRYARALTRDADAAEDLVHDALVAAYASRAQFRAGRPLRQWLFAILHNRFVDGWRDRRRRVEGEAHLSHLVDGVAPPHQEHSLRLSEVERMIGELPLDQREALHLVVAEGLSYQDAAAVQGVPLGTLMLRLGRARARLREAEEAPPRIPRLRAVGKEDGI